MLVGRLSSRWSSPGLTPFLGRLASLGIFAPHQREDVWPLRLAYNMPHTRRIFSGIGFRAWNLLGPKAETLPLSHRGPANGEREEVLYEYSILSLYD
ncbi:hypothetical protein AVEN_188070-1 [Araneus ventricosus]|uniref:Uncharacterized protein n=1 Tax=Araneus ventricosus TaxID=182803 RepID=A0A4Y2US00_ARAVE|nr:hypothetical protein AVEN_188070-1 [Araneus ventricosus]